MDDLVRRQGWMQRVGDAVQGLVGGVYRALKNLLHGTLGHPLHPALADVPIGTWVVAVVADWISHVTRAVPAQAGDLALSVGLVVGLVATASGYTDFHETYGQERQYGFVHGLTMTLTMIVMLASLAVRIRGGDGYVLAAALATAGLVLALGAAYFGGHLAYGFGTIVNHLAFAEGPEQYVAVGMAADFPEGEMRLVEAAGLAVLVTRAGWTAPCHRGRLTHAGGPLQEGQLEDGVVTCRGTAPAFACGTAGRWVGRRPSTSPCWTCESRRVRSRSGWHAAHLLLARARDIRPRVPRVRGSTSGPLNDGRLWRSNRR